MNIYQKENVLLHERLFSVITFGTVDVSKHCFVFQVLSSELCNSLLSQNVYWNIQAGFLP